MTGLVKRMIGLVADFYPSTVFYSRRFMPDLVIGDVENDESKARTALLAVAVAASNSMQPGDVATATFTGITDCGKRIGNFKFTIECVGEAPGAREAG